MLFPRVVVYVLFSSLVRRSVGGLNDAGGVCS
jgi:hypothetical protein